MFYKLKYTNENGEVLEFKPNVNKFTGLSENNTDVKYPYHLQTFEGFGELNSNINTVKSPYQDGSTIVGMTFAERYPYLQFIINAEDYDALSDYRRKAIRILNPKLDGKFELSYGEHNFVLDVKPDSVPVFGDEDVAGRIQTVSINFIAPNPFWQDINPTKEEVAIWRGSFEFPLELVEEGIEMGYREPSLIVNILNKGDVATGMRIQFKALATVENPSLFNVNTREYFKVNRTMEAGEVITVNTHFQNKKVELNKNGVVTNAFNWIDFQSTFLQLVVGDNLLRYDADEGIDNLVVDIYHTPMYLGV